ncbi:MAG TPA: NAD(P)-dependent oxidoreductase [Acetobacteraceae bacterium]|nr:NAD(P)-dependent oxidoreductase [Acetobacteraceae bacterium]
MARIGFVGTGIMGVPMVLRLLERGHQVTAWNLERERLDLLTPHGARAAATPAAAADGAEMVLLCVLNAAAVEAVVFGPDGIAAAPGLAGGLLVDHSTTDPGATREMAARLRREAGMGWVDAPVSGGPGPAREGRLTVMAGGEPEEVERAGAVLRDLAGRITRMGPVGAGQTTKMVNQLIVGTGFVVMAEAIAMAEAAGLDAAAIPACLAGGFADSELLRRLYPQMQARAFDPPASYARQLLKDMRAVQGFARSLGAELPVMEAAAQRFIDFVTPGNEMVDSAAILRTYRPDP